MAQEIGDNNLIDTWASGGTIIEPDSTKKDQGWTLGEKPPHEFMNYLQNEFGKQLNYLMRSGVAAHNVGTNYLVNDIVTSGGSVWIALANNINSVPSTANANWRRIVTANDIPNASETVRGIIEIATTSEAVAGTDGERAVTAAGVEAHMNANDIGRGQTWQNVLASRAKNTNYSNNTSRPIVVSISPFHVNVGDVQLLVDGIVVGRQAGNIGGGANINLRTQLSAIVPVGSVYRLEDLAGTATIGSWAELR